MAMTQQSKLEIFCFKVSQQTADSVLFTVAVQIPHHLFVAAEAAFLTALPL